MYNGFGFDDAIEQGLKSPINNSLRRGIAPINNWIIRSNHIIVRPLKM